MGRCASGHLALLGVLPVRSLGLLSETRYESAELSRRPMLQRRLSYRAAFLLQVAAALMAAIIFPSGLVERRWAGVIAGSGFVLTSLALAWVALRGHLGRMGRPDLWVGGGAVAVLLGVSVPMLGARLWSWSDGFAEIKIWGLSGPQFHRLATWSYLAWMGLVGFRWALERFAGGPTSGKSGSSE